MVRLWMQAQEVTMEAGFMRATPEAAATDAVLPRGLGHAETAKLLGISESHLHNLEATGRIGPEPFRLGRAKRYDRAELVQWITAKCPPRARWQAMRGMRR
jgi:predicted DNA-binding transcriptional regulator AlpA